VLLAELEIRHSRAVAPTRRVALGSLWLPTDPPPGFGGVLLAGVVAANVSRLDDDSVDELTALLAELEAGKRISQPRLRHRFQTDVVGLDRSHHRLVGEGEDMHLDLDDHGAVLPQILGAAYAAALLSYKVKPSVFRLLRRATRWHGDNTARLVGYLTGDESAYRQWRAAGRDEHWALNVLGFAADIEPSRTDILRTFRRLVRTAHPDHGGAVEHAASRITELTQAKRILLADL
jgi:hypothetical protein